MKSTEALPEKADAINEALEVGTCVVGAMLSVAVRPNETPRRNMAPYVGTRTCFLGGFQRNFCGLKYLYNPVYLEYW